MDCREFNEMLDRYEELNDGEKTALYAHAEKCKSCDEDMKFMLSVEKTLKSLPKIEVKSDFISSLNARIDEIEKNDKIIPLSDTRVRRLSRIGHMGNVFKRYSAAAACMLIAVVLGSNSAFIMDNLQNKSGGVINESVVITDSAKNSKGEEKSNTSLIPSKTEEIKPSQTPSAVQTPSVKSAVDEKVSSADKVKSNVLSTPVKTNAPKALGTSSVFSEIKNGNSTSPMQSSGNTAVSKPQNSISTGANTSSGNAGALTENIKPPMPEISANTQTTPQITQTTQTTQTQTTAQEPVQTAAPSVNNVSVSVNSQTQATAAPAEVTEGKTGRSVPEEYSIAMSTYNVSQEELPAVDEKTYNYDADTVESYTLAEADRSGMAIAYGDFSSDVQDGDESVHEYITVSEDGYERAVQIFASYSSGTQDGGYVVSGGGLRQALGEMDGEGITYMTDLASYDEETVIVSVVSG